jgi:hypothetical protein
MLSSTSALDGSEWSASCLGRLTSEEIAPGTLWIGCWVGLARGLEVVEKRKLTPVGIRNPPVAIPSELFRLLLWIRPFGYPCSVNYPLKQNCLSKYTRVSYLSNVQLYNEKLRNLYSSPCCIIRMIKPRRKECAGHVARIGRWIHIGYLWESEKEKDH